jgi:hypothetical protein
LVVGVVVVVVVVVVALWQRFLGFGSRYVAFIFFKKESYDISYYFNQNAYNNK